MKQPQMRARLWGSLFGCLFALAVPGSHSLGTADAGFGQRHRRGYQRRGASRGVI